MKDAQSCLTLCDPQGLGPARILCPWNSSGQNTEMCCHSLLQGIFPTPGIEPMTPVSPASQADSLPFSHSLLLTLNILYMCVCVCIERLTIGM